MRQVVLVALVALTGCAPNLGPLHDPPRGVGVTTTGPWQSLVYAARAGDEILLIDLGWVGAELPIHRALAEIGASPADVDHVFLTHTHRDHITGWRILRGATFHLSAAERPRFVGEVRHQGTVPRIAESIVPSDRPDGGELDVRAFGADTTFEIGGELLRAYLVPGHTAGSAAYLFRGVLFVGDALSWSMFSGHRPDRPIHSDDSAVNRESVRALWARIPTDDVRWVCTAHGKCARFSDDFVEGALQ